MTDVDQKSADTRDSSQQSSVAVATPPVPSNINNPASIATALPVTSSYVPENPFFPKWPWQGPVFLDTAACLCALQKSPDNSSSQVWECQGNGTSNPYTSIAGKWFNTSGVGELSTVIDDTSSPPDTGNPLVVSDGSSLVPLASVHPSPLSIFDQACTGINHTNFTTSYYRATREISLNQPPSDAAPCWREGAIPITLTEPLAWQNETTFIGCKQGFFCPQIQIQSPTLC